MQRPDGSPPSAVDLHSIPGWPDDIAKVLRGDRSAPFGKVGNTQFDPTDPLAIASIAGYPADATKYLRGDATWPTFPKIPRFVTGVIPAAGTIPTAGSGFTYTHASTGVYVFTFTVAFTAAPDIILGAGSATGGFIQITAGWTTSTFTVQTFSSASAASDRAFNFIAMDVQ